MAAMHLSLFARLRFAGLAGLVVFAPDSGGAPGGDGAPGTPAPTGGDPAPASGTPSGGDPDPGTLTPEQQAAVNAEVQRQLSAAVTPKLSAARSKWENDLKAFAEAENLTAEQQAAAARQAAETERDAARREALTARVESTASRQALTAGVKPDRVDALLRLADLTDLDTLGPDGTVAADAVKAVIDQTLAQYPEFKAGPTPPAQSGGEPGGSGDQKIWTRAEIAELAKNPAEFAKHEAEIDKQVRQGLVTA